MNTKEFFIRWGQGIKAITPMQTTKLNLLGNIIVIIGNLIGLISTWNVKWLFIILIGSMILVSVSLLSQIKIYINLKELNKDLESLQQDSEEMKGGKNEQESTGI